MQNPPKTELFSFFLSEKEVNYLCTFLYPDHKKEIERLSKCLEDIVILKKALIYGRLKQCAQIEAATPGLDWHDIIKETFKDSLTDNFILNK
jgi:hypothetical protein